MTEPSNLPDNQLTGNDDEISPLDLLIVPVKHKKLILGLPFVVAVIAAGYSLLMPNIFTANTKILRRKVSRARRRCWRNSVASLGWWVERVRALATFT